jgi:ABC-type sugar transport system ATPase subunit
MSRPITPLLPPTRAHRDGGARPASAAGAAVEVERVSKSFGRIAALRDVSVHVAPGELLVVTGRSGSGKSTLLNLIGGLDQPSAGRVLIDGKPIWQGPQIVRARRELVGFVFQQHLLLHELSAQANLEVPLIGAGVPAASVTGAHLSCWRKSAPQTAPSTSRRCSRAASASASLSLAHLPTRRACCSPTSPLGRSTRSTLRASATCFCGCATATA